MVETASRKYSVLIKCRLKEKKISVYSFLASNYLEREAKISERKVE